METHFEIERKFLVKGPFKEMASSASHIIQGYISSMKGRTVRVRIRDDRGYLTIKGPSDQGGLVRYEFEKEISLQDARFEVDEFYGENEGLILAEIELQSPDEAFDRPDFLGKEVTGDRRYYNSCMRQNPYRLWKDDQE